MHVLCMALLIHACTNPELFRSDSDVNDLLIRQRRRRVPYTCAYIRLFHQETDTFQGK